MIKKILKWTGIVLLVLVILFVTFVGPWPTYKASDVTQEKYYQNAIALVDANLAESTISKDVGALKAG
ncbi:MAG TPA: hypothetical protein PLJ47_15160, partial [Candidatus Hydrogenedentes bacterium]|nr:hypothetical protein [Candidatus Hydrogenedentota bacterium]